MQQLLLIFHVFVAIGIVALVLLQHGKGADMGAAFGSGSSNTMFGSQGSTPFLFKITMVLAFCFFATSLTLTYLTDHALRERSVIGSPKTPVTAPTAPKTITIPDSK